MPRHARLDDVSCAICMDSLFTKRDDLDDIVPVAAPDCGHVFHVPCVLEWFRTQSIQYLAAAQEQGERRRNGSPSLSDAPAECPSCRAECYADAETGEPTIHRLYIDLNGADGVASSSQMIGSSPVSVRMSRKGKERESEVLGLARRAKGIGEEVKGLHAESAEEDVEGMFRRADGLVEDVISVKAMSGIKTYISGLTSAINNLRTIMETHPLIPTLQNRVAELQQTNKDIQEQVRSALPREIRKAVEAERAIGERHLRRAKEDYALVKRELDRQKIERRNAKQVTEEKERETLKRLAELEQRLEKEKMDRENLQSSLIDRSKQLKHLQLKVESRKELKQRLEELQVENTRLKSNAERNSIISTAAQSSGRRRDASSPGLDEMNGNSSIQEISGMGFPNYRVDHSRARSSRMEDNEESLQVIMPNTGEDSLMDLSTPSPKKGTSTRLHPTARTIPFDLDKDKGLGLGKKRKTQSKYFEEKENERPSFSQRKREEEVMVEASSPTYSELRHDNDEYDISFPSPSKKNKTNPFQSTKQATERRRDLPRRHSVSPSPAAPEPEVINLASSSPSSPQRQLPTLPTNRKGDKKREKEKTVVEMLGVTDRYGRPVKGVAMGQKVRRRA